MDDLMTVKDVAGYLRLSPGTVQQWLRKGVMPAAKIGKEFRVRRGDLEKWFERGKERVWERKLEQRMREDGGSGIGSV